MIHSLPGDASRRTDGVTYLKVGYMEPIFFGPMRVDNTKLVHAVERLAEPVLQCESLELVEVQYLRERGKWILRLFIDRIPQLDNSAKSGKRGSGVTLDDCAAVSREIGRLIDVEDIIHQAYTLEVSSPGLDRPLKKPEDFSRFAGRRVQIRTLSAIDGRRNFKGRLLGLEKGLIKLDSGIEVLKFPWDQTERVALEPEVDCHRARRIDVEAQPPVALNIDGDLRGTTPARFTILPAALRIRVPEAAEG